jgi:hypothetical protein
MPPHIRIPELVNRLRQNPALKNDDEAAAFVFETYVVAFDFRLPEGDGVFRHEQEFCQSSKKDEMEIRRRSWIRFADDSDKTSPIILSMLDFEK